MSKGNLLTSITAVLLIVLLVSLTQGCTPYSAPIVALEQPPSNQIKTHLVEKQETLYSIAWRYDYNVTELARINGLSKPFSLHYGQILNLDKNSAPVSRAKSPRQKIKEAAVKVIDRSGIKKPKTSAQVASTLPSAKNLRWKIPVAGKIVEYYNPKDLRKGLIFKAVGGSTVKPAAQGVVVYAGDGLRDYGKLVIIKHTDYLLSAYGYNQKLLVKEGQVVDGSSIISELGSNGRLYFEIRKDGKPVNPMAFIK